MKTKLLSLVMMVAMVFSFGNTFADKKDKVTVTFNAELHCKTCQAKIEKNLPYEKGVSDLKVDMAAKTVKIVYRADKTTEAKLIAAIEKCGVKVFGKVVDKSAQKEECKGDCGSCKSKSCEKEHKHEKEEAHDKDCGCCMCKHNK